MVEVIIWKDGDLTKVTLDRTLMAITDDALAIQYALDLGARKVKLGKGIYYIDKPIRLGHGVSIIGEKEEKENR